MLQQVQQKFDFDTFVNGQAHRPSNDAERDALFHAFLQQQQQGQTVLSQPK
jgi:hypothetical protein